MVKIEEIEEKAKEFLEYGDFDKYVLVLTFTCPECENLCESAIIEQMIVWKCRDCMKTWKMVDIPISNKNLTPKILVFPEIKENLKNEIETVYCSKHYFDKISKYIEKKIVESNLSKQIFKIFEGETNGN
jgi:hypothetical protein